MKNISIIIIIIYFLILTLLSCKNDTSINNPYEYIKRIDSIRTTAISADIEFTQNFDEYDFYSNADTILYDSIFNSVTAKYDSLLFKLRKMETQAYGEDDAYRKSTIEFVEHLVNIKDELFNEFLKESASKSIDVRKHMIIRYQEIFDELYLNSRNEKIKLYIKYRLDTINEEEN